MNIFLINNIDTVNKVWQITFPELKNIDVKREIIFLCSRWAVQKKLEVLGFNYQRFDDLLTSEDCFKIDESASRLARNWYKSGKNNDFTLLNNISLGSLIEFDLIVKFVLYFKFLVIVLRAIKQTDARIIYHDYPRNSELATLFTLISQNLSLKIIPVSDPPSVSPSGLSPFNFSSYPEPPKINLKMVLKNVSAYFFNILPKIIPLITKSPRNSILFYGHSQVDPILENWLEKRQNWNVVFDQSLKPPVRLCWRLIKKGALVINPPTSSNQTNQYADGIQKKWTEHKDKSEYQNLFVFEGISLREVCESKLDEIISQRFLFLTDLIIFYENALKKYNIKCIILPNDCIEKMRLVVLVAQKLNIPSLVIQHGILLKGTKFDNNHRIAKYSAFWSRQFKEEFVQEGLARENAFVTGAPYFDRYFHYLNRPYAANNSFKQILVVTTNAPFGSAFGEFDMPETFITSVMSILEKIDNVKIVVKIHPAESIEFYHNLLKGYYCNNLDIIKKGNLAELLATSDLIISAGSTVLFEGRIFKKPIIYYQQGKFPMPAPLDDKSGLCVVNNISALGDKVRQVLSGDTLPATTSQLIDEYIGSVDGESTKRIMEVIDKIC